MLDVVKSYNGWNIKSFQRDINYEMPKWTICFGGEISFYGLDCQWEEEWWQAIGATSHPHTWAGYQLEWRSTHR